MPAIWLLFSFHLLQETDSGLLASISFTFISSSAIVTTAM
jgi:hypothetical protein